MRSRSRRSRGADTADTGTWSGLVEPPRPPASRSFRVVSKGTKNPRDRSRWTKPPRFRDRQAPALIARPLPWPDSDHRSDSNGVARATKSLVRRPLRVPSPCPSCDPAEVAGGGAVVTVASEASLSAGAAGVAYTTSEHAVIGLVKSVAYFYGPKKIRSNAVLPGPVITSIACSSSPSVLWAMERAMLSIGDHAGTCAAGSDRGTDLVAGQ
jgi:NAD(P)-dependent dehydrogenase (short-subunit alcohol dehydrogenase family)